MDLDRRTSIAMVLVMPLTGFLGGFFGQKRVYVISMVLFVVGSALCGTARTLPVLVLYRVIQGLGGGALQPTQQAILRQTFPPEEQGMAMAMFSMVIMVGPAVGPVLGGCITDNYVVAVDLLHQPADRHDRHPDDGPERPRAGGRPDREPRARRARSARTSTSPASC